MSRIIGEATSGKIDTLTSLRFFAAFAIVLYHIPSVLPALYSGQAFSRFNVGVDFFFVLSGYVLGVTYSQRSDFRSGDYFRRRFARIYPVYLLTTIVWMVLFINSWPIPAQDKFNSGIAHLLLVHAFLSGFLYTLGFNAPAWTISCEAFFYAVFPLMRRKGALVVAVVSLALYVLLYRTSASALEAIYPNFFGYFPIMQVWKFAAGLALAHLFNPQQRGVISASILEVGALVLLALAVQHGYPLRADLSEMVLVAATLIVIAVFACESGVISRALLWGPLILLGEASYGLYLWHHMLMLWAGQFLPTSAGGTSGQITLIITIISSVTLLSVITYRWFELPLRRWIAGRPNT